MKRESKKNVTLDDKKEKKKKVTVDERKTSFLKLMTCTLKVPGTKPKWALTELRILKNQSIDAPNNQSLTTIKVN